MTQSVSVPRSGAAAPAAEAPTGLWLNGARGSVATTAITGLLAIRDGMAPADGCVTEHEPFDRVPLPRWRDIVVGGHDIVDTPLEKRAEALVGDGVVPRPILEAVRGNLPAVEAELRNGYDPGSHTGPLSEAVDRLAEDITDFRRRHNLARVVVVNVASTEPPLAAEPEHDDLAELERALADPERRILPPSSVVACAAFRSGSAFVDFTPSTGARIPALATLARRCGVPYAGSDGKTGQTLLRTTLAPMFPARALRVHSWAGINLLGGGDGATLGDPVAARSKLRSKSGVLPALLGAPVTAPLHIDNVPDMNDHKTSWDHVSFSGFLGVRMTMQVTWCGIDSALAAPLVLDLTRLVAAAHASGRTGPVEELAFFFKDPIGTTDHALANQLRVLTTWATSLGNASAG